MSSSPRPAGMGTLYVNDYKAQLASILGLGAAAAGLSPSGSPATEGCGVARRPQTRQEGGGCISQRNSPSRHGSGSGNFDSVTPPPRAVPYSVSASRGTPLVTPTRGSSANRSGERVKSARRGSRAAPLLGTSAVCVTPTPQKQGHHCLSPATSAHQNKEKSSRARRIITSASQQRSPTRDDAQRVGSPSAAHTNATLSTGVGSGYVIHANQHPLYAGRGAPQRKRISPPPAAGKPTGVQGDLAISVESNTVRRLQRGGADKPAASVAATKTAPVKAATASGVCATVSAGQTRPPAQRGSIIEQLAAATQMKGSNGSTLGQATHEPHANVSMARSSSPRKWPRPHSESNQQLSRFTSGSVTKPLGPLRQHDRMRMHLQQASFNVSTSAASEVDRRLPNDTLVLVGPERMPDGEENPMYTQLKAFQLPQAPTAAPQTPAPPSLPGSATTGCTSAAAPSTAPPPAVPGAVTAAAVTCLTSAPAPAPAAGIPAPVVAPPPPGADVLAAAALAGTTAASPAPPPPPPPAVAAVAGAPNAPTVGGSAAGTGASAAAAAPGARLSAQPVSARKSTREEMTEAEEERLLRDLIATSHHDHRCARRPPPAASAVLATGAGLTAAIETALQLRREANNGALHGWRSPPANVLLPDPTQSAPTWAVLKSAPAQEAQQAAAVASIARPTGGVCGDHPASPANDMTAAAHGVAENAADGDETARVLDSIDYHAPFQCVLHPEYVEHDLVPAALSVGVVANTGVDDPMKSCPTNRTTPAAAAAAAAEQRDDVDADALATAAAASSNTAVQTLVAQAVILRDPLSLLACEHLAEDTIDITARRRAYLRAIDALHGITRGGALFTNRPGALASTLQEASPLGAVFCELSYPAKVLLSAILYMRSLGALPSLLRAGPLTEYSPVVDKENCIELVFYNPSDEEQGVQAAQEEQQKSGELKSSRHPFERERAVGSTVLHSQVPADRVPPIEAVTPTNAPGRARSQLHTEGQPSSSPGASLRSRSGRQFGNTARGFTGSSLAGKGEAHASHAHNYADPSPSPLQKRRPTAIEDRLMSVLSATAMRRASSATSRSVSSAAVTSRTVSPHRFFSRAISASLARPQLHNTEASLMAGDTLDGARRLSGANGCEPCPSESGGSWLLRKASQDGRAPHVFAHQVGDPGTNAAESLSESSNVHRGYAGPASGRQRRQKLSQLPAKLQERGLGRTSAFASRLPHVHLTPPSGTSASGAPGAASQTSVTTAIGSSALRRSSVIVALEDLQQAAERGGVSAAARAANAPSSPSHLLPGGTGALSTVTEPAKAMPPPPTHFEAGQSATTCSSRAAATPASGSTPASAYGPGVARFPKGEQELCVVLRAVVAQKSHVYSFGKAETVHVLPPLPQRSAADDGGKALLRKQTMQKAGVERLATDSSSPLHKFLCSGDKLRGEAKIEGDQLRAALLDRARRAAAAARRRVPVTVHEKGMPTSADYGDLVVAFVLSGNASELSGSVPDMMELEALRYRIFSLQGYSASDPAGMQAVKEAAGVGGASAAAEPPAEAVVRSSTTAPSSLEPNLARLQQHFAAFNAFHTPASSHPKTREPSLGASSTSPCASFVRGRRHTGFFEDVLQRVDPLADLDDGDGRRGLYLTELDVQQRQKQDVRALILQRYPIYRASSVAESTLQTFFAEAKEAVVAARQQRRRRDDARSSSGRRSTSGGRFASPGPSLAPLTPYTRGDAATTALQDSERDLLRFRPMNLNSFHRELTDAVQCALDLQTWQGKKNVSQALHM
ncbi:conserved hypothetical protein [Leishmania mexicana MHOM/GT/2001/U1103]|uniref:Uncharacterized protein n=1 Tax=Leishmania mexicana (strain MHOM/GT/2001/U1103) TaxID=929439 RepID=E9AY98_LEIMU|nr:conserved hypothetical protein [Leishmania mexicana MHOM/GT/2001/U1103]CBZ27939.1 conserved hypothetical protein [Leishmania mexicana MHOM/GT/2001/U1103]